MMLPRFVLAQADSVRIKANEQQLRFGIDISRPIMNAIFDSRKSYEFSVDYHLPNDLYLVAEGGFGGSDIQYSELKYTSSNSFFKIGVDKSMLPRLFPGDWDFLFVGARYGIASIKRSEASFTTKDPVWGTTTGQIPATSFVGHWAELTAGLRVELLKGFFAGYTVRGKFLINQGPFKELPPSYVAGYGNGEKTTVFDFNFYLQYAIRWK
jgi:hypothetical protein